MIFHFIKNKINYLIFFIYLRQVLPQIERINDLSWFLLIHVTITQKSYCRHSADSNVKFMNLLNIGRFLGNNTDMVESLRPYVLKRKLCSMNF